MAVTKRDLVVEISEKLDRKLTQAEILTELQTGFDLVISHLCEGETIELRNFGVCEVQQRRARVGRNPNDPASEVKIPPRAVVKFKPGKEMRERVADRQKPSA